MYEIGDEELAQLEKLFRSKKLFRYQGKDVPTECSLFETELARYMGSSHGLLLTSGTNALLTSLKTLGIGPGDEVIIPAFTFVATPAAVLQAGARPVVVNIDEKLSLSVEDMKRKTTDKTKAVIPVHMDGLQCDMKGITDWAKEKGLFVVEDVAQAVGGSFQGIPLGAWGDFGCYSFNVDKIISCGEGGALICQKEALYKKALMLHDVAVPYGATYSEYLRHEPRSLGHSMRVSEISGSIMRVQLKRLPKILAGLRERKTALSEIFHEARVPTVMAHDPEGDCGTSLHFSVNDPLEAHAISKKLLSVGLKAMPTSARPAHCYWQWIDMLNLTAEQKQELTSELAPSKMLLTSNVKIFVELDKPVEEIQKMARMALTAFSGDGPQSS